MKQYISKAAIVAEIESLRRTTFTNFDEGVNATVQTLLDFLDTLEVKEKIGVDLGDPKGDVGVKTAWTDLEEAAIKYGNCFEKHSDLASMAFIKGAKWGKEQAEIQIKAQSMALPHGCPKKEPVSEDLEEAAMKHPSAIRIVSPQWTSEVEKAFKAGAKWQEEQLMKDAVYGLVCGHDESSPAWIDLNLLNKPNVKVGTEVKLIIIKDEQL